MVTRNVNSSFIYLTNVSQSLSMCQMLWFHECVHCFYNLILIAVLNLLFMSAFTPIPVLSSGNFCLSWDMWKFWKIVLLVSDTVLWLMASRQRTRMLINNLQFTVSHPSAMNHLPQIPGVIRMKNAAPNFRLLVLGTSPYLSRSSSVHM